jgi:hypothetical protein
MKRQIMGREVVVAVTNGRLGFWHLGLAQLSDWGPALSSRQ